MSPIRHPAAFFERPNPLAALCDEIAHLARTMLHQRPEADLHHLSCDFSAGVLTLRGLVRCESLRQAALKAVAAVPGVIEVENQIEVGSRDAAPCLSQQLYGALVPTRAAS